MVKLSILIPTTPDRWEYIKRLKAQFYTQLGNLVYIPPDELGLHRYIWEDVEVVYFSDDYIFTVGEKRNILLNGANGEYVAFIDSDDRISLDYVELLMEGINKGVDCCSLVGEITVDGKNPKKFIHSNKYDSWFEKDNVYYRCVNHLNCIKKSIALQIGFPKKNHGEDRDFSIKLKESGLLKTEHEINNTIYHYDYRSK